MNNIFVYGSLMFNEVWSQVVQGNYARHDAILSGYKRLTVRGKTYPGLMKSPGSSINGVVYLDVSPRDLVRLDKFEGSYYRRIWIEVTCNDSSIISTNAYLFRRCYMNRLGRSNWTPLHFQSHHLMHFTQKYRNF